MVAIQPDCKMSTCVLKGLMKGTDTDSQHTLLQHHQLSPFPLPQEKSLELLPEPALAILCSLLTSLQTLMSR